MAGMGISGSTDYSALFSSLSGNSSQNTSGVSSSGTLLADYASIKNGSYAKLAKSYYGTDKSSKQTKAEQAEANKTQKTELMSTKNIASKLSSAASALTDNKSLFETKITTKDKDGNEMTDLDREKISKLVNNFVDNYNAMVKNGGDSTSKPVLRSAFNMVNTTNVNENLLNKAGITLNEDNTLSIDEDTLKKADAGTLKSLFSGQGSYASNVQMSASSILQSAQNGLNKLSGYNAGGTFNAAVDTGSLYSSFM
ncbi:MAG: hypothetical protein K6G83_03510 [Lachnospiraceae bacterium]|nr:hypothetical protein [Lachnospiraceae bacterium]